MGEVEMVEGKSGRKEEEEERRSDGESTECRATAMGVSNTDEGLY
jgi:hypothetical protein